MLWQISHAAPPPAALPDADWSRLWTESDRSLYCAEPGLPSDWGVRAEAALEAKRVPGFALVTLLQRRNLLPFFVFVVAALLAPSLRAEDAAVAYRRGDFATAEKLWRAAVTKDPADPIARHNLSLALAQQDHWETSTRYPASPSGCSRARSPTSICRWRASSTSTSTPRSDCTASARRFLAARGEPIPFVIGLAGSVAVGKSTTARALRALLARWPAHPRVDLVTTDGFLWPNKVLDERGLMNRKGFPESYDFGRLLRFLADVKSGRGQVVAPIYDHIAYDVVSDGGAVVERPDILIVEGLNVLQPSRLPKDGRTIPYISDFFDFSIYIDAEASLIERWYVDRFLKLRETAFRQPQAFFHRYGSLSDEAAKARALELWRTINLVNLTENIVPTRQRADLILRKGEEHRVVEVQLRKL